MSNLATSSPVQRLNPKLLCHCGQEAVMAYGFPGVSEQAVCATHEHGLVLRREIEPGRALVATVRRFDTVPGPAEATLNELKSGVSFETNEEIEYFRNRVAELGSELDSVTDNLHTKFEAETASLRGELASLRGENQGFRNRVAELGTEVVLWETENASQKAQLLTLRQFLDQNGLADPTAVPAEPAEPSSRVE